ncbi:MFS transporter [Microtetraspora sp. NBRC 13810]|uniref:MFS transporter n=1 Tax=Microtetraspora sp. NBRC 13810 TaxID=3030990 RepID=UPI002554DFE9|nr:MFS transporter [Microtetraspora sp. NBRC 13810]
MDSSAVKLVRDRATWLIYLQLSIFATYLYGLSGALPLLRIDLGFSPTVAGLHGTAMAAGGVTAGLMLARITARFGRRAATWAGLAGMNLGVLLVILGHTLPMTLLGFGLAGGAGTLSLYIGMAALSDHHGRAGAAAISEANAVAVLLGIAVSLAVSAAAHTAYGWRVALLATPILTVSVVLAMGRVWIPEADPAGPRTVAPAARREPYGWRFHVATAVLFCCVALEFGFNMWAAELVTVRTGLDPGTAATALTAFTAGLAAGRFAGARLALTIAAAPLLTGALAVTAGGWTIFWLSTHPVLAYAGLILCGLGVALHFPLSLSQVIAAASARPDQAAAMAAVAAGVASGAGPFALGALADGFGAHSAFLLTPILIALAVAGVLTAAPRRTANAT